jgi:site-specific recombinase XerD
MTKRKGIFDVNLNLNLDGGILSEQQDLNQTKTFSEKRDFQSAVNIIIKQMKVSGYRERTISDYIRYSNHFQKITKIKYVEDISSQTIYDWLDSMDVSAQTKLTRLKCLKAILGKFLNNQWIESKFWHDINIKVSKKVKTGANDKDVNVLLSLIDVNTFIGLRDAVAVLMLYRTGVRINTLGQLEQKHIDFNNKILNLDGAILKNHQLLKLPIDDEVIKLLKVLITQNNKIRNYYNEKNEFIFISAKGKSLLTKSTNNAISKRLHFYSKKYGLDNINPHALRRGFAKNLLNKGANLALISKALGHSNLEVTTQYLDINVDEVVDNLRSFI